MAAIYSYVKENIEWNGVRDLLADPPRKVFDQKKGTSSDINIHSGVYARKRPIYR